MTDLLSQLHELTRTLGTPAFDAVVIGEGNTSTRIDAESFWIKASGRQMSAITPGDFVAVRFAPILALIDQPDMPLAEQKAVMRAALTDPAMPLPSVEVTFHAMLLSECAVNWIGHTHPTAVNGILCSTRAESFAKNRLFPDEVVMCGPESVFVPYIDPGTPLCRAIQDGVRAYTAQYETHPQVIHLANHGMIALGSTPAEIVNITAMTIKAARIFQGACSVGEPVFMRRADILHIARRPDEIYRRRQFVQGG
ncbi:MAG: class II aldolase/adducin family protein [bacterium]|nr:class II aldolase/adducin family protein [bacterium]